jgi:hypothetical protein
MVFIFFTHDESASFGDDDPPSALPSSFVHLCDGAYDDQQPIRTVHQEKQVQWHPSIEEQLKQVLLS